MENNLKEKFNSVFDIVMNNAKKLDEKKINVEHAKASASLMKQANNILCIQLDAAKFIKENKEQAKELLNEVGL